MLANIIKRHIGTQDSRFLKKFYKKAKVVLSENNKYKVVLDERNIRTPLGNIVETTNKQLSQLVAHEFNMQDQYLRPSTMPMLAIVRTCIDFDHQEETSRPAMQDALFNFLQSDTIRYRDNQQQLKDIQDEKLQPIINFINKHYDINMTATQALISPYTTQTEEEKERVMGIIDKYSNWKLMAVEHAASNMKSTSLAVSLMHDQITIQEAVDLSYLEEQFQIDQDGLVEGSHDLDKNTTLLNVATSKLLFDMSH